MGIDILVLNTIVADIRKGRGFEFVDELVGEDGLQKCETKDMPAFSESQYREWSRNNLVTAGGPGNSAPLMARAGLDVAVAGFVGKGKYTGFDALGNFFVKAMDDNDVNTKFILPHVDLPTGTTFIHKGSGDSRGGIAYFANGNDEFSFHMSKRAVEKLKPKVVYYLYSGLSENGDANEGKNLAAFMRWCKEREIITIADSHTLNPNPKQLIKLKQGVKEYELLKPLLPQLDIFFTSSDEARLISNTLYHKQFTNQHFNRDANFNSAFINKLLEDYDIAGDSRRKILGVTYSGGAYFGQKVNGELERNTGVVKSKYKVGKNIDLVGAGDAFRAGFLTYVAKNHKDFTEGDFNIHDAIQMGNLFAALYIKAPLDDRYGNIHRYKKMMHAVKSDETFHSLREVMKVIGI